MTRGRDLGIPFDGSPGEWNAITDVPGVEVGHETIISGEGPLERGVGPVRTGVTAVLPRGMDNDPVFAGWFTLNGKGEMTGTTWLEESGFLEGPLMITNTYSVGLVRDATVTWISEHHGYRSKSGGVFGHLPVVAETYDGFLNDIYGNHVRAEHTFAALEVSRSGPVAEGNVGGGTGMMCHRFKGGIGTASRQLAAEDGGYRLGVLVQSNYGLRKNLTIAGVPVGREITDLMPVEGAQREAEESNSIIVVVATDAPLVGHQLKRLARRVPLGISKMGGLGANSSGDIFVAFSTANPGAANRAAVVQLEMLPNDLMNPLFEATCQATEEAIVNAMVSAETMVGIDGNTVYALPLDRLQACLSKYNRLSSA